MVSLEPAPPNIEMFKLNCDGDDKIHLVQAALVADEYEGEWISLWLNPGINHGMHSTVERRGRSSIDVPVRRVSDIVRLYEPSIMKVDIEGAEYGIFTHYTFPDHVRKIAMEIHFGRREWRYERAPLLVENLRKQGFKAARQPAMQGKQWATVGVWRR